MDAFYLPVASRFRTYGVELDGPAQEYVHALLEWPPFLEWCKLAESEPYFIESVDDKAVGARF